MNKFSIALLLAAGLFLIDVSPAAAHEDRPGVRLQGHSYQVDVRRQHQMPGWLRHDRGFYHWYRQSPLRHYRQIGWHQLHEIYRWERRYFGSRHYVVHDDRRWKGDRRRYRHDD